MLTAIRTAAGDEQMTDQPTRREFLKTASGLLIIEPVGRTIRPATIATLCGTGERGMAADGEAVSTAKLNNPYGMAEKKDRASLYFVENQSHRIVRYDRMTRTIHLVAGVGVKGSAGNDGLAMACQLAEPHEIRFDSR